MIRDLEGLEYHIKKTENCSNHWGGVQALHWLLKELRDLSDGLSTDSTSPVSVGDKADHAGPRVESPSVKCPLAPLYIDREMVPWIMDNYEHLCMLYEARGTEILDFAYKNSDCANMYVGKLYNAVKKLLEKPNV